MPFINVQGTNTHYLQNDDILVDRPSMVFVHGAGGTSKMWVRQLSGIKGYNLIALDLPGHGRSEGTAVDTINEYSEFVWQFVQALELGSFVIAGHSMGGAIAMELALAYPNALDGMIIVDSGASLRVNPMVLEVLARGEYPLEIVKYSYSFKATAVVLKRALEELKTVPSEVYRADFRACDNFNIMDRVGNINLPALVLCGQDDQMTPVKYSNYLSKELAQSTFVLIADAGHMAMLEQPERVNKAIQIFLDQALLVK
ncbi:MAG: alpha/beta hydrolase [Desulfosporosinus sp.]|nr:alpha/beta hydrolase [Desulfosporosinus sp.]